jgi:hypothetical protein
VACGSLPPPPMPLAENRVTPDKIEADVRDLKRAFGLTT